MIFNDTIVYERHVQIQNIGQSIKIYILTESDLLNIENVGPTS
jgi:hypothetical protein